MKSVLDMSVVELCEELTSINDRALHVETVKATRATNGRYVNAARGKKPFTQHYASRAEVKQVRNVLYFGRGK